MPKTLKKGSRFNFFSSNKINEMVFFVGLFLPGMFFVVMGVCAIVAPQLMLPVFSSLLVFLGCFYCALAWKLVRVKRWVENTLKNLETKVSIYKLNPRQDFVSQNEEDEKKIIMH